MAALAHNVLKTVGWLYQSTGPPVPLNPRVAADGLQANAKCLWGAATHGWVPRYLLYWIPDEERRGFDERCSSIVAPCPSVKLHFFNKPISAPLTTDFRNTDRQQCSVERG